MQLKTPQFVESNGRATQGLALLLPLDAVACNAIRYIYPIPENSDAQRPHRSFGDRSWRTNYLLWSCWSICFCSTGAAQEAGGVSDSKKKCFPLWDGYCVKSKRCVKNCNDPDKGKGFTKGRCKIFTCECCRPDTPDEIAPSADLPPPEHNHTLVQWKKGAS